ncbi:class I SAM-dependent methyltransferase [Novosphingobium mangrovi (ex Huang et al. 2023)]|uniref:Class I SAM-dependent methyltransferase n=1 Tax=Novosphingobium mangrovi (ex Huang et al. 2023) TaxID=2976432 RepID=A0ABT2I559_9SPHN|nr:class I SAM-dependent methyltransferase [Novosphingobium mangrovi (ex Huang et al. 2023)]MCT2399951.1 class I SAM-dependent methyltransferase [Novosphingobium mangrovi (ex Huang et al. 2023)]
MIDETHPHADALKYEDWGGEMGARWLANLKGFEGTIAPAGEALLARAAFAPGERVIDLGCGGGATTMAIAEAVGPDGCVLGLDISPDLTEAASRRARQAGAGNARFLCADAACVTLAEAPYDRLVSRFGSMFFAEPVAAFTNLRSLLRSGGRIDLAVWGPPAENPWMLEGMAIARRHVEMPAPVPRAPGPFAFEDLEYLREVLDGAGFRQVDIGAAAGELPVGGHGATAEEAQAFARNAMAFGQVLLDYPQDVQAAAARDLTALYDHHFRPGEGVMMGYCAWLVSARA